VGVCAVSVTLVIIDIQLNQGAGPWSALREAAIAAEETGYSTLWNLDHFSGSMFRTDSMLECFTSITAWAGVTKTIGLGTLVTNVMNRETWFTGQHCVPLCSRFQATDSR
jgi:alkanesulfonate monooxygenase SsuD/methylene tetrahydromethanopterin reductase-like flavin-dependent oxidoreductase (luciferase family)